MGLKIPDEERFTVGINIHLQNISLPRYSVYKEKAFFFFNFFTQETKAHDSEWGERS